MRYFFISYNWYLGRANGSIAIAQRHTTMIPFSDMTAIGIEQLKNSQGIYTQDVIVMNWKELTEEDYKIFIS